MMRATRGGQALATLALALGLLALSGCARAGGDAYQATLTDAVPVGEQTVGQTFRPGAEHLAGVDLLTATFGEPVDPDGRLIVSLVDHGDDDVVASASVDSEAVADNQWVSLRFDEPAAAPDRAALIVEWTGESPLGLWANVPPAGVQGETRLLNDPYAGGQLLRGGQPATGDLAFRIVGDVGAVEPVAAVARLGAGAVRSLAAAPAFGVAWAAGMAGAVALAVIGFRGARRRR